MRFHRLYDVRSHQSVHAVVDWHDKEHFRDGVSVVVRSMDFETAKADFARVMKDAGNGAVADETKQFFGLHAEA